MAEIYKVCSGGTLVDSSITMTAGDCVFDRAVNTSTGLEEYYNKLLTFTLTIPNNDSINVRYSYTYTWTDRVNTYTSNGVGYVTIPAGVTSYSEEVICKKHTRAIHYTEEDEGGFRGLTVSTIEEWTDHEIASQSTIPTCAAPPVDCNLEITGTTQTTPTFRGDSDGTITVYISGATGTTVTYIINGETKTTTGPTTGYTFTNLEAGVYDIIINQGDCYDQEEDYTLEEGEFRTGDLLINEPADLVASENPVIVRLGTAINDEEGRKALYRITLLDETVSDGYWVKFQFTSPVEYTRTFYAKGFPNQSNYFLASVLTDENGITVGSNTRAEIIASLGQALIDDPIISANYNIYIYSTYISIISKRNGTKYNLDDVVSFYDTSIMYNNYKVGGIDKYDGSVEDNYSLSVEVMVNNTGEEYPDIGSVTDYTRAVELELPFNTNNVHRFNLSNVLKSYVSTPRPEQNFTGYTMIGSMMRPYRLNLYENYPLVRNSNTKKKRTKGSITNKYVINSSLNRFSSNNMSGYTGSVLHDLNPYFNATFGGSTGNQTATITSYTSTTTQGTSDIQFKLTNTSYSQTFDWQSSPVFSGITGYYPQGYIYVSGNTNGVVNVYRRSWWSNDYGSAVQSSDRKIINSVNYLTNSPNPKLIQRSSQEYLYFILTKNYGHPLIAKGDIYFYDGTEVTGVTFFNITTGTTNAGGVAMLNLSYDKLGLESYENSGSTTRRVKRVEVAIYQEDAAGNYTPYTEIKKYRFEIEDRPRRFGVLFENELGGYDSFDFVGIVENSIDRSSSPYTVPLQYNDDGSLLQGSKYNSTYNTLVTKTIVANSGWIDEDHYNWLIELLKSNNIYSYTTEDQNYLTVNNFTYTKSSLDDLYQVEVSFTQTIHENNITV